MDIVTMRAFKDEMEKIAISLKRVRAVGFRYGQKINDQAHAQISRRHAEGFEFRRIMGKHKDHLEDRVRNNLDKALVTKGKHREKRLALVDSLRDGFKNPED